MKDGKEKSGTLAIASRTLFPNRTVQKTPFKSCRRVMKEHPSRVMKAHPFKDFGFTALFKLIMLKLLKTYLPQLKLHRHVNETNKASFKLGNKY